MGAWTTHTQPLLALVKMSNHSLFELLSLSNEDLATNKSLDCWCAEALVITAFLNIDEDEEEDSMMNMMVDRKSLVLRDNPLKQREEEKVGVRTGLCQSLYGLCIIKGFGFLEDMIHIVFVGVHVIIARVFCLSISLLVLFLFLFLFLSLFILIY